MDVNEVRKRFLAFNENNKHAVIERDNLILHDDPTTLFTGSGMQPLMPYLLGKTHPKGSRLTNSQACFRAQDIEDIGDSRHTTFFEMLGNWSLGDYFKQEQIRWVFDFLVNDIGLDPNKLYVTCFIGSKEHNIPRDDEAAQLWKELFESKGVEGKIAEIGSAEDGDKNGMGDGRIFFYDDGENWWSRSGNIEKTPIGDPCGTDSEIFYDFGEEFHDASYGKPHPASDSGRFFEIGNSVFMTYQKNEDGSFSELENKNIDCGLGLERIATASIDSPDVFMISTVKPLIEKLEKESGKSYESHKESMRVIVDHYRAATFLVNDGAIPSNKEHGYVLRKLIRRAVRFSFDLGLTQNMAEIMTPVVIEQYEHDMPDLKASKDKIIAIIVKEEKVFRQTLAKGIKRIEKDDHKVVDGKVIFELHDTYGFPKELSVEEFQLRNIQVDKNWADQFEALMQEQKERSRTAAAGTFKGGLGGQSEIHKKYHTTTHIMYRALRMVLGDHVEQRGSNITEERTRFDFNHPEKVTPDQVAEVEAIVNGVIKDQLPVSFKEMPTEEALASGARGHFGEKYGDISKVYFIGPEDKPWSTELCGGPHIDNTKELGEGGKVFKVIKEQSSSAGIRRIKAVLQ